MLTQLEPGKLQNVTIDYGTPPDALTKHDAIVGIELSKDEVLQLPVLPLGLDDRADADARVRSRRA